MPTRRHEVYQDGVLVSSTDDPISAEDANADTVLSNAQSQAGTAITQLRAYIALSSPTAAQTTAAVKLLCRAMVQVLRLVLSRYDDAD